jgi:hypothetical protein
MAIFVVLLMADLKLIKVYIFIKEQKKSMKKERVRINLDVNKELAKLIKEEAERKDITQNAMIRLILQGYFENKDE